MLDYGDSFYLMGKAACYMLGDKMSCTKIQNVREGSSSFSALMAFQLHSTRNVVSSSSRDLDHLKVLDDVYLSAPHPRSGGGKGMWRRHASFHFQDRSADGLVGP